MALDLPASDPGTAKTKIVATKVAVSEYHILRSLAEGIAKSHMVIALAYGNQTDTPDPNYSDVKLFQVIETQANFINDKFGDLAAKLTQVAIAQATAYAAGGDEPTVTGERITSILARMKAADEENEAALLALVELLQDAGIKSLPTEEISDLQ